MHCMQYTTYGATNKVAFTSLNKAIKHTYNFQCGIDCKQSKKNERKCHKFLAF